MALLTEETTEQSRIETRDRTRRAPALYPLMWILAAGVLMRAALCFYWADLPIHIGDEQSYNQLAIGLVEQGQYVDDHGQLTSLRPPLYPALVAAIYRVFGSENYTAVRVVQLLLSLVTVVIVYRIGCLVWSPRVGMWAAAAVCFYPSLLAYNNLLLSEVLFTLCVVTLTWLIVESIERRSLKLLVVVGFVLGVGALTRSILWLFAPILGVYLFLVWDATWPKRVLAGAIPFMLFALTIAPWAIRNSQLHKTFTTIDVMGGRNAMMGNYEHTPLERSWATIELVQGENAWHRVLARETPGYSKLTQGQIDKLAMKHGISFALKNPLLTLQRDIVRFFNFWQLEREIVAGAMQGFFGNLPKGLILVAALIICGSYAATVFLAVFGALMSAPPDRRIHGLFLLSIAFPCAIHSLIFAHSRYHIPIIPIVLLYAAAAVTYWPRLWQQRRTLSFRLAIIACIVLTLGWIREFVFVDLAKTSQLIG
jgi:4-amino-4-deoxy-L-arabinose transferase-like glycosyltransferase